MIDVQSIVTLFLCVLLIVQWDKDIIGKLRESEWYSSLCWQDRLLRGAVMQSQAQLARHEVQLSQQQENLTFYEGALVKIVKSQQNKVKDMRQIRFLMFAAMIFLQFQAIAQLVVTVSPPKTTGSRAVVKLEMKNTLSESVASARATVFLLDGQNKVIGESTKWVIGGAKDKPPLAVDRETNFNFVIQTSKPIIPTNLTARVSFNRAVFTGGKLADVTKDVVVMEKVK